MITANFGVNETYVFVCGLWQWDYGRKLKIVGIPMFQKNIQIHFSEEGSEEAVIMFGTMQDENIIVDIPDKLLESGKNIIAYLYVVTKEGGYTIKKVTLFVKPRARPNEKNDDVLQQILNIVKGKADNMILEGSTLQLTSEGRKIGNSVELPGTITDNEIDELFQ